MPAYRRFLDACRFVNIKQVKSIVEEVGVQHLGTLVLFRDNVGRTPLMYIVDGPEDQFHNDRNEITLLLLKHLSNQDVNMTDYVGNTALHYVCHHGNIPLLTLLLSYEANISMINNDGESCVTVAARGGYTNCIALLLSSYHSTSSSSSSSISSSTLTTTSVSSSSLVSKSSPSSSPISVSSSSSSNNEVYRNSKSIKGDNDDNETPIVIYGSAKIIIFVTQKLMDLVNKRSKYGSALYVAIQFDQYDTAELLLKCQSKVNSKSVSSDGLTCLMQAVMNGSMNMVALLLQYDADVMLKDKYGMSCLYKAAIKGHINIMRVLRDYICITKYKEEEEEKEKAIFISILNEQDYIYKETMLMKAARLGYHDIVSQLLDWGADVLIRNNSNNDAVHNARTIEIKTLLQAAVMTANNKKQQQQQQQQQQQRHQPHKVIRTKNRPSNTTAVSIIIDDRAAPISTIVSMNTTLNRKSHHHHHNPILQDKKYDIDIHKINKNNNYNNDNNNKYGNDIDKLAKGDGRKLDVYKKDSSVSNSVKVNLRMTNNSSFRNKNHDNHDETEEGSHQNHRSNDHCNGNNNDDLSIQNNHNHDYQHSYICTSLSNLMLQRDEMDILQSIYTQDELLIITPSPDNPGDLSPVLLFKINSFLSSPSSLSGSLSLRLTMPDGYPSSTCIEVEVIIQDISMMDFTFARREQLCEIIVSIATLFLFLFFDFDNF